MIVWFIEEWQSPKNFPTSVGKNPDEHTAHNKLGNLKEKIEANSQSLKGKANSKKVEASSPYENKKKGALVTPKAPFEAEREAKKI